MPHVTILREVDEGEIPIRIEYDYQPAEKPVLYGDYPEPGCPESVTLYPPTGIVLSRDEVAEAEDLALDEVRGNREYAEELRAEHRYGI